MDMLAVEVVGGLVLVLVIVGLGKVGREMEERIGRERERGQERFSAIVWRRQKLDWEGLWARSCLLGD